MSDRLFDVFDEYVDRLLSGERVEDCDFDDPELAELLGPLLTTSAEVVRQLDTVRPSADFKHTAVVRMRNLFYARQAKKDVRPGVLFMWWQRRWATAMATALVFCLAGIGIVAASVNALPSGFFYPVKTATEQVQLTLTTSDVERAQLQLQFTERRLTEMTEMAGRGDIETAIFLAAEVNTLIGQMCVGGLGMPASDSTWTPEGWTGSNAAMILTQDREGALGLLECALDAAPAELQPDIERLMTQLSREFDETIAILETHTSD
jgi:hypothetical protein